MGAGLKPGGGFGGVAEADGGGPFGAGFRRAGGSFAGGVSPAGVGRLRAPRS